MNLFCGMNIFMNNGLNSNFTPFSGYSFNNFSFFNIPSFNFGWNLIPFNFDNFSNLWSASSFNSYNNISIFNDFSTSAFSNCWNNFSYGDTFSRSSSNVKSSNNSSNSGAGSKVLEKAMSYVGKVNNDADGVRLFSPAGSPSSRGWCADFATYCASQALGSKYPKSMITGGPFVLMDKARENNCWVSGWKSNAKPGDIVIVPGKGVSGKHVAIIKSIDSNGKITCVSGNSSNSVRVSTYNTSSVEGFVSMEKLA